MIENHYTLTPEYISVLLEKRWDIIPHGNTSLLEHCVGVARILTAIGSNKKTALAGLFHSSYGAATYQELEASFEREELRDRVGEQCEELVFAYSAVDPSSLYDVIVTRNKYFLKNRYIDDYEAIFIKNLESVLQILLANLVEQHFSLKFRSNFKPTAGNEFFVKLEHVRVLAGVVDLDTTKVLALCSNPQLEELLN